MIKCIMKREKEKSKAHLITSYLRRGVNGHYTSVPIPDHIPKEQRRRYIKEKRRKGEDIIATGKKIL